MFAFWKLIEYVQVGWKYTKMVSQQAIFSAIE
jgi:hypothetical protein